MNAAPSVDILDQAVISTAHSSPLHRQVQQFLREAIEEHFEDGQSFWTEMLLMERLGVSRGTVRQALSELAREGLLVREASRRTFVSKTAVTSLGLIFMHGMSDFVTELVQHFAAECLRRSLHLEMYPVLTGEPLDGIPDRIRNPPHLERIIQLSEGEPANRYLYELLADRGYRAVNVGQCSGRHKFPSVATDSELAVQLAVEHLRALGHRRIVFLANEPVDRTSVCCKIREFERFQTEQGLSEGQIIVCDQAFGGDSFSAAYKTMPKLWELTPRPTAVMTASDPGAWAVLRWFAEQSIKVPAEVSVIGFENVKPDAFTQPPLTSVGHAFDELAQRAIELLWQRMTTQALVSPYLVVRESTGQCPERDAFIR